MPKVIALAEAPQTIIAVRKAQNDLLGVAAWLKMAKKNADDTDTRSAIEDMEFDVRSIDKGLTILQKNVTRRNPKSSSVRHNLLMRLQ